MNVSQISKTSLAAFVHESFILIVNAFICNSQSAEHIVINPDNTIIFLKVTISLVAHITFRHQILISMFVTQLCILLSVDFHSKRFISLTLKYRYGLAL